MQKHADVVDRFKVNKNQVKMIFVDETLIQIDGQDYWLWIAYEPDMDLCLMMHISRERTIFVCYLNSSNRYGRNLAEKPYSQMVLDGI
jgi:transposase-like protein